MLPENTLSSTPIPGVFTGARYNLITITTDYEDGGIGINDASQGLLYQQWKAQLVGEEILLSAPNTPEFTAYTGTNITEISFTFDQNMRFTLAFIQAGQAKLFWYDTTVSSMVVTVLASDVVNPRLTLDDKRINQSASSDIILAYKRGTGLYYRQQRDRYTIEYLLATGITQRLNKIGFSNKLRLQFYLQ
jgi:hypothetical protein